MQIMTKQTTSALATLPDEADIRIKDLNVTIATHHSLHDVTLSSARRGITCIIGPSGCGKTTLLKSINRLLEASGRVRVSGSVTIDGEDIYSHKTELTHLRQKVGLLSQRPTPLPMSIYDNIAFGCRLHRKMRRAELTDVVESNLRAAGLWDEVKHRLHSPASSLSIGQQQRLCLARGLAVEPQFILGDESTSALDPVSSRHIEDLFLSLKSQYGIVLVTHTLRQALRIADHVIFIYMGKVVEVGSAKDVFHSPKHELTKQYLQGVFS